jgi:phosphate transport system permease protein
VTQGPGPRTGRDLAVIGALMIGAVFVLGLLVGVWSFPTGLLLAVLAFAGFGALLVLTKLLNDAGGAPRDDHVVDLTAPEPRRGYPPPPPSAGDATQEYPTDLLTADHDRPFRRRTVTRAAAADAFYAAAAGGAISALLRTVLDQHGILGSILWWYVAFLVVYYVLVRDRSDTEAAIDRMVTVIIWSVGAAVAAILAWMLLFLLSKGLPELKGSFFTQDMSKVGPLTPGGGVRHAIIGTLEQVGLATIVVVPVAVLTAIYLHEIQGILTTPVRFIVDAMSGIPSIVAGLLIFSVWVNGRGFSGIAGSAALVVLMLPTVTRASEEILRTIPGALREGALALGAPQWSVIMRVVVPTARAGLVTAVILGIARAVGETAPMLLTAFGSDITNSNPLSGPQSDLPLFVWKLIRLPNDTQVARAWSGALVLVLLVLVLFVTARYVSNRGQKRLGRVR